MDNMRIIAIEQLGIGYTEVQNIATDCGKDSFQFNFDILNTWRNRTLEDRCSVRKQDTIKFLLYFSTNNFIGDALALKIVFKIFQSEFLRTA